jgi:small ligand-binding sensory domain FIST
VAWAWSALVPRLNTATGFSLLLLNLPETTVHPVRLPVLDEDESFDAAGIHALAGRGADQCTAWIVVAKSISTPGRALAHRMECGVARHSAVGGLASGGRTGDQCFVFHDREVIEGGLALGFAGGVRVDTLVSQGCRPVGEPFTITGAEGHLVTTLGSRPAYSVLDETFGSLTAADKQIASGNLFVGLAMSEYLEEFKTGDFLIRNLLAVIPRPVCWRSARIRASARRCNSSSATAPARCGTAAPW